MNYRDYTKEIGTEPRENRVPWPVALLMLAALALGLGWVASTQAKTSVAGTASSSVAPVP